MIVRHCANPEVFGVRAALLRALLLLFAAAAAPVAAQTDPSPQSIPLTNHWGTTGFTSLPAGFAVWQGVSGSSTTTQALAESSVPTADATAVNTNEPVSGNQGGWYGYAVASDARLGILTSSNATGGAVQLAMALNTTGKSGITLAYDLINMVNSTRTVGAVCQYRVGASGGWTTIVSGTGNPYVQSGGTKGAVTHAVLTLPTDAENRPVVQIRWAVWRGTESGSSSGFAIDNIAVDAAGSPGGPVVSTVSVAGTSFEVGASTNVTVQLTEAPPAGSPAVVSVASGGFSASPVTVNISYPSTSGSVSVTMANAGVWTANATAVEGCSGSAVSESYNVSAVAHAPTAYAGGDKIVALSGGSAVCTLSDATAGDPDGWTGLTYVWTPAASAGISGWTQRVGSVTQATSPGAAAVTFTAPGSYVFTLTVTDPTAAIASDSVTVTVTDDQPADPYGPPAGYYNGARPGGVWLTGTALKSALRSIISANVHSRSYEDAETALQLLDQDPANPNNILLIYTGASVPKTWQTSVWNREHQWPQSLLSSAPIGELFNLRPCNPTVNGNRGNKPYGLESGEWNAAIDRGACARTMFYMATRYTQLSLISGSSPDDGEMGDLDDLLSWHYENSVNTREKRRNHLIWSSVDNPSYYQGNRNPYIDHPELVWTIFGGGNNNSKLYLGSSPPADGASVSVASFRVMKAAALPAQTVTLNKTGSHPTTYEVIAAGDAASTAAGIGQTFAGGSQSRSITVSIGSTATAGLRSGTIVVNNTELSSGGSGLGSADGNDVISVSAAVLEHANGSFSTTPSTRSLTLDFGAVQLGSGTASRGFVVHNLAAIPEATANLDLDSVSGAGHTAVFTSGISVPAQIIAGGGQTFTATMNPQSLGTFTATYSIAVSDENVPGATAGAGLMLTLTGTVVTVKPDFIVDGFVDSSDRQFLLDCIRGPELPLSGPACNQADLDLDGDVDQTDFGIFQRCYGGSSLLPALDCAN